MDRPRRVYQKYLTKQHRFAHQQIWKTKKSLKCVIQTGRTQDTEEKACRCGNVVDHVMMSTSSLRILKS